ncbi:MAG: hybrid sensor histidine kinase/response regulator [Armatimonadota bacterium]|nr:MAG: hybrid sensor histidine kinase/response regulator [Armatimonadota bacterium]
MTRAISILRKSQVPFLGAVTLAALYGVSRYDYLLFHSIGELFSIVVAFSIFVIAWNTRHLHDNAYLLLIGIAYFFVGTLDLLHTLAYKGMGVFPHHDANLSTQLWIAGRGLESLSLLIAPLLLGKKLRTSLVFAAYFAVVALLLLAIFAWGIFPVCYVDAAGGGLTQFKIVAEYVICCILIGGLIALWARRTWFDPMVVRYLAAAVVTTILAELAFTAYVSVYGTFNLVGHLLKIVSFYMVYRAIVQTGLAKPYDLLFRELKQREEQLQAAQQMQEQMTRFLVHDLRSPLTSVLGGIQTLREGSAEEWGETREELFDGAIASASWLLTLTNALLDASRLESGKMPVRLRDVDVGDVINAACQQVSVWAGLCRVGLVSQLAADNMTAVADRELTMRILVNLLSNAIKYSPYESEVTIRVAPTDGNAVAFSVTDRGPGIPRDMTDRVFERFGSIEARDSGIGGTGLGLNFCKLAVEAQGGRIWIDSDIGRGTTVFFTLPASAERP